MWKLILWMCTGFNKTHPKIPSLKGRDILPLSLGRGWGGWDGSYTIEGSGYTMPIK
jgi:hypothetical protein